MFVGGGWPLSHARAALHHVEVDRKEAFLNSPLAVSVAIRGALTGRHCRTICGTSIVKVVTNGLEGRGATHAGAGVRLQFSEAFLTLTLPEHQRTRSTIS